MENKIFRPKVDKSFFIIWVPTLILLGAVTVVTFVDLIPIMIMTCTDLFVIYFLATSLVGYVELREETLFVKFGFVTKREIPYGKIREISKKRSVIADSMLSLKNSLDHVNIKYNRFDVISVSVRDNDELIRELELRLNRIR